ncbi:MAG TPA: hypothetical protein VK702_12175 [Candidatus Acidoferrum sp.]|jgi:hypothetical protein|nr:hypothetical protein [Candidatus Acidoferrum sp.]
MKKGTITTLGFGGALLAAALLAACGGGGGTSGSSTLPSGISANNPGAANQSGTTKVTIHLPAPHASTRQHTHATRRRDYVSAAAGGVQIAVTAGGVTQTVYANISSNSPLCTNAQPQSAGETCTIAIPVVGANETIVGTEVNQAPTASNPTTGYGTGFPTSSAILATGSTPLQVSGGAQQVTLGLNPIAGELWDCEEGTYTANFGDDYYNGASRIVVTAGVASTGIITPVGGDEAGYNYVATPSPLPSGAAAFQQYVDVNGNQQSLTLTAPANVQVAVLNPASTAAPSPGTTATIPDDSYVWDNCYFEVGVSVSASLPTIAPGASPSAVVYANNLTATLPLPFVTASPNTYGSSYSFNVVPISVSPATTAITSVSPGTVAGFDWGAPSGMNAESAFGGTANACIDTINPSQSDAAVSSAGAINTTTWQQSFTITELNPGTCTFVLYDSDTGVVTTSVTVTAT